MVLAHGHSHGGSSHTHSHSHSHSHSAKKKNIPSAASDEECTKLNEEGCDHSHRKSERTVLDFLTSVCSDV